MFVILLITVLRDEQPEKQLPPKNVTDEGISIDVREVQPLKQLIPNSVTDEGMNVFLHPTSMVLPSVSIIALHPSRES